MVLLLAWLPAAGAVSLGKLAILPEAGEPLRIEIELYLSGTAPAAVPRKAAPAAAGGAALDRELQRMQAQLDAGDRVLAGMLERVAAMEVSVRELQRRLEAPAPVKAAPPAPKAEAPKTEAAKSEAPKSEAPAAVAPKVEAPKVEAPKVETPKVEATKVDAPKPPAPPQPAVVRVEAPQPVADMPPRRTRSWVDSLLNEALLLLAGSALVLLLGAVWWMWGRRVPKAAQIDPEPAAD